MVKYRRSQISLMQTKPVKKNECADPKRTTQVVRRRAKRASNWLNRRSVRGAGNEKSSAASWETEKWTSIIKVCGTG